MANECDCPDCQCNECQEKTPPPLIQIASNIFALAFFFHIVAYNIGMVYYKRKCLMIAVNNFSECMKKSMIKSPQRLNMPSNTS